MRLIAYFLVIALLVTGMGFLSYNSSKQLLLDASSEKVGADINVRSVKLQQNFDGLKSDLTFISNTPPIQGIIRAKDNNGVDPKDNTDYGVWVERLETTFESIIEAKKSYIQIRYIDEDGNEMVRVDFDGNTVTKVATEDLQNKKNRPYFTEAMKVSKGNIFVSDIDLNREHGEIEVPYKPTVRYATPVFDSNNKRRGIIITNIFAQKFIDDFLEGKAANTRLFLVDQDGFYLSHPEKEKEWGGPADLDTGENFNKESDAPIILSGNLDTLQQKDHIMAYAPIFPDEDNKDDFLVSVSRIENEVIFTPISRLRNQALLIGVITIAFTLGLGLFVSYRITKPLKKLTGTVDEISKGNFNVNIEKGSSIKEIRVLQDSLSRVMITMKLAVMETGEKVKKEISGKKESSPIKEEK